jgi:hypothetical protein
MSIPWCPVCQTRHASRKDCPGELLATGPERHAWRVKVSTPTRTEAYGVLVAESGDRWRARVLTYPNILWSVPGGRGTLKFVGDTAQDAERKAIEFIREHCREREYELAENGPSVESRPVDTEPAPVQQPRGSRGSRHLRSLVVRYGEEKPDRVGMTADLSKSGLFVIADDPLPLGTDVKMLLELERYSVPLGGKVAWLRDKAEQGRPAGMGILLKTPPNVYARYVGSLED